MFNPYAVVLVLFAIAGVMMMTWGGVIILNTRKTLRWPAADGTIEESKPDSDADDLLPHVLFSYSVNGQSYHRAVKFPGGVSPSKEFTAAYIEKFPTGKKVPVYYDPLRPESATLEPGMGSDWMIFALGLIATLFAIAALFFSG